MMLTLAPASERQRKAIEAWSRELGHQVVTVTEDADVSGSTAPQGRAGLGPLLSNGKVGQWDVLVVAKLDRVSRALLDFASLPEWCLARRPDGGARGTWCPRCAATGTVRHLRGGFGLVGGFGALGCTISTTEPKSTTIFASAGAAGSQSGLRSSAPKAKSIEGVSYADLAC
jgi:hypothetical protein